LAEPPVDWSWWIGVCFSESDAFPFVFTAFHRLDGAGKCVTTGTAMNTYSDSYTHNTMTIVCPYVPVIFSTSRKKWQKKKEIMKAKRPAKN